MLDSKWFNFRRSAHYCKRVRNRMKKNALRQKPEKSDPSSRGKDAGRLNVIFPKKNYALKQENVKGKDGRGGERAEGRKRYGIAPGRSAELPDSHGLKAGIRFELRRRAKKRWMESKQLDLTSLGILG